MTVFQKKHRNGIIDVWWLYDDGGNSLIKILTASIIESNCFQLICKWQILFLFFRTDNTFALYNQHEIKLGTLQNAYIRAR